MPEFYIVPPRLIVGSFDRANVVTSVNNLRGDLTFTGDLNGGITVKISGNNIQYSTIPGFFVKRAGDTFLGNLDFTPSGSNYGLALAQLPSDPGTGRTGGLYFNTTDAEIKYYYGSVGWTSISFQSGISVGYADANYLRLDASNDPMQGDLSMNTYFFQVGNKATQVSAGQAGQIYWNTDSYRLEVYNDDTMAWEAIRGIQSLNGLTEFTQTFSTGVSGNLFNIVSSSGNHTFNIPIAGTGATGLVSTLSQSFAGSKTFTNDTIISSTTQSTTKGSGALSVYGGLAVSSNVSIGQTLLFFNSNNSNYIGIRANTATASTTYILPSTTPASGSSFLSSTIDGTLSWNAVLSVPLSSIATTAQNINLVSTAADSTFYLTFSNLSSGSGVALSAGTALTYNASTKALSSDLFLGNLVGSAVTATNFYGTLNGTATTSTNVHVTSTGDTSSNHFLLLSRFETGTGLAVSSATGLSYNPSTGVLIGTTFQGNVQGNVFGSLTGFATTATNINVVSSGSDSANHFLLFTRFETGTGLAVSSATGLSYNPSTGVLIGTTFQGNLSGIADTALYSHIAGYAITSGFAVSSGLATSSTYSDKVAIVETDADFAHPLVFSLNTTTSSTGTALSIDDTATYNPSSNILNLSSGSLAANGVTIGSAQRTISTNTGNLILDSVGGTVQVNDNLTVSGNLTVQGTTTTIDSTVTSFKDPVIVLGAGDGNTHSLVDDNKDRGLEFRYAESGTAITGFFGYKDDKKFYYIPNASVNDNVYTGTAGTIVANLEGIASTSNYSLLAGNAISTDSVKRGNQYELGWYSATGIAITGSGAGLTWNNINNLLSLYGETAKLSIGSSFDYGNSFTGLLLENYKDIDNNYSTLNSPTLEFKSKYYDFNSSSVKNASWKLFNQTAYDNDTYVEGYASGDIKFTLNYFIENSEYEFLSAAASTNSEPNLLIFSNVNILDKKLSLDNRSGHSVAFQLSSSGNGRTTYTLPVSAPGTATSILQSTPSGVLSWIPLVAATATSTANVFIATGSSNSNHPIVFTPNSSSSGSALSTNTTLSYNPSTDTLNTSKLIAISNQSARFYNVTPLSSGYDAALFVEGGLAVSNNIAVRKNVLIGSTYPSNPASLVGAVGATFIRIVSPDFGYNGMGVQFWDGQTTAVSQPTFALVTNAGGSRSPGLRWSGSGSSTDMALFRDTSNNLIIQVLDATRGNLYDRLVIGDNNGQGTQFTFGFASAGNSRNIRFATESPVSGSDLNGGEWRFIGLRGTGNGTPGTFLFSTGDRNAADPTAAHSTTTALLIDEFGVIVGSTKGTNSTSTLTGTARINGGLGVTGNAFIGGTVTITNTTTSTLTTNGALVVSGGVGIAGSVFVGNELNIRFGKELRIFNTNNTRYNAFKTGANGLDITYTLPTALPATGTGNSVLVSNDSGTLSWTVMTAGGGGAGTVDQGLQNQIPYYPSAGTLVTGSSNFTNIPGSGVSIINPASNSSSTTTGALVVRGGVGITGNLYVGGSIVGNLTGTATTAQSVNIVSTSQSGSHYLLFTPQSGTVSGGGVSSKSTVTLDPSTNNIALNTGNLTANGVVVGSASNTISTSSGDLKLNSTGGTVIVQGNLNVQGTTTTIDSTITTFKDPVIVLGAGDGNTHSLVDDGKDRGLEFRYAESGTAITGFFGYKDDKKFYYIPNASVNDNVYTGTAGTIVANLEGTATTSNYSSQSGLATTASNVNLFTSTEDSNFFITFSKNISGSGIALSSGIGLSFNPNSNTLTADKVISSQLTGTLQTGSQTNITQIGTITTGVWNASAIATTYGGTGLTTYNKGDLLVGTGASILNKLPVGTTNDYVLMVDSAQPLGVKWSNIPATPASSVPVQSTNDGGTRYLTFVDTASSSAGLSVSTDLNLTYDAATNILNVGILSGSAVSFVNGANYSAFKYSGSAKTTYTLPDNTPQGTGTSVLASDQGGIMYWTPMSATSSGSATTAKNIETTLTDANSSHYLIFSNNSGTSGVALSSTSGLQINPSSDAFISGSWQASAIATTYGGTGLTTYNKGDILVGTGASILTVLPKGPNRYVLSSNTFYSNGIGWTQVAGVSITNLAPSTVTALNTDLWWNNEDGSFNIYYDDGNTSQWVEISNAFINPDTVQITATNSTGTKYLTFSDTSSGSGLSLFSDTNLTYDSSTNQLFVGSLSGSGISILNGSNYSAFVYAGSAKTTYTLPANTPQSSAGTSVLSSTIDGVMSWVPMTATGGANIGYTVFNGNNFELAYYFQNGTGVTGAQYIHNVGTGMSILYAADSTSSSTGALVVRNGVGVGQSLSIGGRLQIFNGTNSGFAAFRYTGSGNTVYTLPDNAPISIGASFLTSDLTGNLAWIAAPSGGTGNPGGSDTQIQFNNGGSFNGATGLTYSEGNRLTSIASTTGHKNFTAVGLRLFNPNNASNPSGGAGNASTIFSPAIELIGEKFFAPISPPTKRNIVRYLFEVDPTGEYVSTKYDFEMVWKAAIHDFDAEPTYEKLLRLHYVNGLGIGGSSASGVNYFRTNTLQSGNYQYTLPHLTPTVGQVLSVATVSGTAVSLGWSSSTGSGTVTQINAGIGLTTNPNGPITTSGTIIARRIHRIQFASSFNPTLGADSAVFTVPFDPNDGTSSMTMRMKRVECRVETTSALGSSFSIQKYAYRGGLGVTAFNTDSSVFIGSTTNIMPGFLEIKGVDTYEVNQTTFAGSHITAVSGDKMRLFFNDVSALHQNFSISLLMEQEI